MTLVKEGRIQRETENPFGERVTTDADYPMRLSTGDIAYAAPENP